jgi:hypothetical protein
LRWSRWNKKKPTAAAFPLSDANWMMLNEVMPSGAHAAELAVEIGPLRAEPRYGLGDGRIFMGPVEPGAREQPYGAMIEARMQAVAVELDFIEPMGLVGVPVDQLRELRPDPLRQR